MNGKERLQAVFDGRLRDKVPHLEMVFQIPEAAFGLSWPSYAEIVAAKTDAELSPTASGGVSAPPVPCA